MNKYEERLLENYINEMMDPHSWSMSREFEGDPDASKKALEGQAESIKGLTKIIINNTPYAKMTKDLVNTYYARFKTFAESGNRESLGIENDLLSISEKFMVSIYPEITESIMTAHVQAYVTEWKKGFDGAGKYNIKKLVHAMSRNKKNQSEEFRQGYLYRIKAYKQKTKNNSNIHSSWNDDLEKIVIEKALANYDKVSSVAGGVKELFQTMLKDMNILNYFESLCFYKKQFGLSKTLFLFIIQATILGFTFKFLMSKKVISAITSASFISPLIVGKKVTFFKFLLKIIRKKVLTFFSNDSMKKQLVELELYDKGLDPNIDLDKLYLEKYIKLHGGTVLRGGKFGDDLKDINFDSELRIDNTADFEFDKSYFDKKYGDVDEELKEWIINYVKLLN